MQKAKNIILILLLWLTILYFIYNFNVLFSDFMVTLNKEGFYVTLDWDAVNERPKLPPQKESVGDGSNKCVEADSNLEFANQNLTNSSYTDLKKELDEPYDIIIEPLDVESIPLNGKCIDKYNLEEHKVENTSICNILLNKMNYSCDSALDSFVINELSTRYPQKKYNKMWASLTEYANDVGVDEGDYDNTAMFPDDENIFSLIPDNKYIKDICCRECMIIKL